MRKALKIGFLAVGLTGVVYPGSLYAVTVSEAQALLKSTDVIKRRGAAQDLVNLRSLESAPALIDALKDKDSYVRNLAARGLGYMHWTAAESALSGLLANDASAEVRQTAALSLRFLNDPSSIPALIKAVKDPAKPVRLTAIASLGAFRDAKATPALTDAAKDPDPEFRRTAIGALGQIADPATAALLVGALKDADVPTRANAAQALGNLPAKEGVAELREVLKDTDPAVRLSAARSLALKGDRSGYDTAIQAVNDPQPMNQVLAIDTLGFIQDKNAIPALEGLLQSKNKMIQQATEKSLKRIREKQK